jgi:hypothetical protein
MKRQVTDWRFRVLLLTVTGALLATLGQELAGGFETAGWWRAAPGVAAGIALALAAYFSREVLGEEQERRWVRARSIAEALKAEAFLFRAEVPPYSEANAPERLAQQIAELLRSVDDLPGVTLPESAKKERLPSGPLTVEAYIRERVDDQVSKFYLASASRYEKTVSRIRTVSLVLGALAAALGVLSTTKAAGTTRAAGWVAVITTITAALAAYLYAGRFQYLIVSYQATARQLETLKVGWKVSSRTEGEAEARFIKACEDAISIENNAWMAKLIEKKPEPAKAEAQRHAKV